MTAGGTWDHLTGKYTDEIPARCKVVDLQENQVSFARDFSAWLAAYRDGLVRAESLYLLAGPRRVGKTTVGVLVGAAACLEVPGLLHWNVSNIRPESDELDRELQRFIPGSWYRYIGNPRYLYRWANGSITYSISADDPETLKRGRGDLVFVNEGQKLDVLAVSNALGATIDTGGAVVIAANSPRRLKGEWVRLLREKIEEKSVLGSKLYVFGSQGNKKVDAAARSRVASIFAAIDPKAQAIDDLDVWAPVGDRAYPRFHRSHIQRPPELGDITESFLRKVSGRSYPYIGGVDFQGTPHHAGVILRVFGTIAEPIYCAVAEVIAEQATEDDFLDEVDDLGYTPESLIFIGDASGQWQDGKHSSAGRGSFDIFKARRWHIKPPKIKKTDRGEFSKNPHVADRLNLVAKLLEQNRLIVDPGCVRLIEALKDCPMKPAMYGMRPFGKYSHITDALGYALYFSEPKPRRPYTGTAPSAASFPSMRPGANFKY